MSNLRVGSFLVALIVFNSASAETGTSVDVFTPVIASMTISPEAHLIRGTEGAYHVVYELQLTNTKSVPATIQKIEVLAGTNGSQIITSFSEFPLNLNVINFASAVAPK